MNSLKRECYLTRSRSLTVANKKHHLDWVAEKKDDIVETET